MNPSKTLRMESIGESWTELTVRGHEFNLRRWQAQHKYAERNGSRGFDSLTVRRPCPGGREDPTESTTNPGG